MLDKIAMILEKDCGLQASDVLLVGVSGGPDSLFLLHCLHHLGYPLVAAHLNHQLRPGASEEAHVVSHYARNLGVEFISSQVDVLAYAEENSVSVEEAARILRYRYLFKQAERITAKAVLVGHNAADQVETILMHILRGSGITGLRGMDYRTVPNPWSQDIPLLRPLLSTSRQEILGYLAEHNLTPIYDESNQDTSIFRNKLRHELLPVLETYNPHICHNLLRMAHITRDDYSVIQEIVNLGWQSCLVSQSTGYQEFRHPEFIGLATSIQRYVLRRAIEYHLPGLRDIDLECIERGRDFLCHGKSHGQVDLMAGLRLIREGDIFWVALWQVDLPMMDFPAITPGQLLTMEIPSTLSLANGWKLQAIVMPAQPEPAYQPTEDGDPFQAYVEMDGLELPLVLRSRKAGERFKPAGMDGHSLKVSDLMINVKIPRRARKSWPLVCSGDEIIWVPGYRVSERARVKPASQVIVRLLFTRDPTT